MRPEQKKTVTMYMHLLDGKPAYVLRYTRGRSVMHPYAKRQRVRLLPSLYALRTEVNEVCDDAYRVSKRDYPMSPREVHNKAAMDLIDRISYRLVEVPCV